MGISLMCDPHRRLNKWGVRIRGHGVLPPFVFRVHFPNQSCNEQLQPNVLVLKVGRTFDSAAQFEARGIRDWSGSTTAYSTYPLGRHERESLSGDRGLMHMLSNKEDGSSSKLQCYSVHACRPYSHMLPWWMDRLLFNLCRINKHLIPCNLWWLLKQIHEPPFL